MNCIFLYNPHSGKNKYKNKLQYIINKLHQKFDVVDFYETKSKDDAMQLAKDACGYYDAIIFSGGDGTVNDIVNAIANEENKPTLGYIPSGTCNDFARSLKLPNKLDKAVDVILNGEVRAFDIFKANNRFGVYVCATGLFTSASYATKQKNKRKLGKLAYYFNSFGEIFTAKTSQLLVEFEGERRKYNSILTLFINSCSVAGYKLNKNVDLHDGKMEFLTVMQKENKNKLTLKSLLTVCKAFLFGIDSVKNQKNVEYFKFEKCNVSFCSDLVVNIDGENAGMQDVEIEVYKNYINFFVL